MVLINVSCCRFKYTRLRGTTDNRVYRPTVNCIRQTLQRQYKTCIKMMPPRSARTIGGSDLLAPGGGGVVRLLQPLFPLATGLQYIESKFCFVLELQCWLCCCNDGTPNSWKRVCHRTVRADLEMTRTKQTTVKTNMYRYLKAKLVSLCVSVVLWPAYVYVDGVKRMIWCQYVLYTVHKAKAV